ncbi:MULTISPECIES: hypothetical protein [unclassified Pseudofrankia]|uniref:hypothetical protein n=1 Tax=unclassified Pseudofrankia TaxID=2994372 RepID=UPI00090F8E51|nr:MULTISPECIES: hypothetical protein [unclassified Pseudofrankia]MDT3440687.1 hypothetical protein [Pseudofrankia sp. BMG5.37]OHV60611.1 hypothetical protein BCD48_05620 [Pseudofrankia sp. BMG5.36]
MGTPSSATPPAEEKTPRKPASYTPADTRASGRPPSSRPPAGRAGRHATARRPTTGQPAGPPPGDDAALAPRAAGPPPGRPRRRVRILIGAGVAVVLVAAGTVTLTATPAGDGARSWVCHDFDWGCATPYALTVQTDPDQMTLGAASTPRVASYVAGEDVGMPPAPPGGRDDCYGRAAWAASLGAVPADTTPVQLNLTAGPDETVEVVGFTPRLDGLAKEPRRGLLLTCAAPPGLAGAVTSINLDMVLSAAGARVVVPAPAGQASVLPPGASGSFLLAVTTATCDCRWRVEVELEVGDERRMITVGPDGARDGTAADNPGQPSFETTGSSQARPARYIQGTWQ